MAITSRLRSEMKRLPGAKGVPARAPGPPITWRAVGVEEIGLASGIDAREEIY